MKSSYFYDKENKKTIVLVVDEAGEANNYEAVECNDFQNGDLIFSPFGDDYKVFRLKYKSIARHYNSLLDCYKLVPTIITDPLKKET